MQISACMTQPVVTVHEDTTLEEVARTMLEQHIGGVPVVRAGAPVEHWEAPLAPVLKRPEFTVELHLGAGRAEGTVWTTDLSYEYVKINADYRT